MSCLQSKGHAVVVVAEGAGEEYMKSLEKRAEKEQVKDGGGHVKLPPIGMFIKETIEKYCKDRQVTAQVCKLTHKNHHLGTIYQLKTLSIVCCHAGEVYRS